MSKPLNSFILYCKEYRPIFQSMYPGLNNSEITSLLGKDWSSRSEEFKAPFKRKSTAMTKAYNKATKTRKPKTKISALQFRFTIDKPKVVKPVTVQKNTCHQEVVAPTAELFNRTSNNSSPNFLSTEFQDLEDLLQLDFLSQDSYVNNWFESIM